MKSFEHDYYVHQPISQGLLMSVRSLGEFRGRQALYRDQFPEVLETLRRVAVVQSIEASIAGFEAEEADCIPWQGA